eukprot:380100-Rhodomonas_salina.2
MRVLCTLALFALCGHARAFVGVGPLALARGRSSLQLRERTAGVQLGLRMMGAEVDEKELIKVFGRMAEKTLFGDGSAGACCHSGCFPAHSALSSLSSA